MAEWIVAGIAIAVLISIIITAGFLNWRSKQQMKEFIASDVHRIIDEGWKPPSGIMLVFIVLPPILIFELLLIQLQLQSFRIPLVLVDPTLLGVILISVIMGLFSLFIGMRYHLVNSMAALINIDSCIRSPLLNDREDVWITKLEQPRPIDVTLEMLLKMQGTAGMQLPVDERTVQRFGDWITQYTNGKKIFGYLLIRQKPKTMFGVCTGMKQWDEVFRAKRVPMPTNWFTVPVTSGHMDLVDTGVHKVVAPDEIAKKLNVSSMNLTILATEDETAVEAAPLIGIGYDYSRAAVFQQRAFAAEADARKKERDIKKMQLDSFKMGTLERLPDVMRTGDIPKKSWREVLAANLKWIIIFVMIVVVIVLGIWVLGQLHYV